jgi:hypothetical protein
MKFAKKKYEIFFLCKFHENLVVIPWGGGMTLESTLYKKIINKLILEEEKL